MRRLFLLLLVVVACTQTPGVADVYCEGHTEGVAAGNRVAARLELPGPVEPECPTDRVKNVPDDKTAAEIWCYGWLAGFTDVALSHYPDQPPSTAWMVATFNGCVASRMEPKEE